MDTFIEYLRFSDFNETVEYTSILKKHKIPFQLDDISMQFKLFTTNRSVLYQFILRVKETDLDKINKLFGAEINKSIEATSSDHYLFAFSNDDILDVIANQDEWTKNEVKLALNIAKERMIDLSAESIKGKKKISKTEAESKPKYNLTIDTASVWFLIIAIFSVLNLVLFKVNSTFRLPGLIITELFNSVSQNIFGIENEISFILCLIISSFFLLFWYFGKANNKWVFLTGVIIYGFDAFLSIISKNWINLLFHFFILLSFLISLGNSFKENK